MKLKTKNPNLDPLLLLYQKIGSGAFATVTVRGEGFVGSVSLLFFHCLAKAKQQDSFSRVSLTVTLQLGEQMGHDADCAQQSEAMWENQTVIKENSSTSELRVEIKHPEDLNVETERETAGQNRAVC